MAWVLYIKKVKKLVYLTQPQLVFFLNLYICNTTVPSQPGMFLPVIYSSFYLKDAKCDFEKQRCKKTQVCVFLLMPKLR